VSDERRGLWGRVVGWFKPAPPVEPRIAESKPLVLPKRERKLSDEERWLEDLSISISQGERLDDLGGVDFRETLDTLWSGGRERLVVNWLGKLLSSPMMTEEYSVPLRVRLVELLERRSNLAEAMPHLEALLDYPEHATRAHYLLAEQYRKTGDEALALRHYEAVLARDVDYPNVRVRLERLRAARGIRAAPASGETMAGPEAVGATGGARYQLVREMGRGATGVVYMARDVELERDVAVKLLHPHLAAASRANALALFFNEARITASLRHPNILAILDIDEDSRRLVMELAAGGTLRSVLEQRGPRTIRRALERHAQVISALAAAHRRGIVHRDLKPANLMFRRDADAPGVEIVLGDFGIAHLPDADGVTRAEAAKEKANADAVGTLAYMPPEQRRGEEPSARSDLYASAVVLFEMLTGRYPWSRNRLLAGTRTAKDFELPANVTENAHSKLIEGVQTHLHHLGQPVASERPTTSEALAEAQRLRDIAIAEASG